MSEFLRIAAVSAGILLVAFAAFYGVLVARAMNSLRSRMVFTPVPSTDAEHSKHASNALASIIKYRTISHDNPDINEVSEWVKLRDRLRKDFPKVHKNLTREIISDYSLLYIWKAEEPSGEPLLLCAHTDIVDADGDWEHPPFSGVIDDGYIWGRGALDCKCNIIAMMEAIESLLDNDAVIKRDVYLAFSHDHESDTVGANALARYFAERNLNFYMTLDEGGWLTRGVLPVRMPVAQVGVAEKGRMRVKLSVNTSGGHASLPPSHTAVGLLSEAIARVEYRPHKARLTPVVATQLSSVLNVLPFRWRYALVNLPITKRDVLRLCTIDSRLNPLVRSTVAAVKIEGGSSGNTLPGSANAYLDIRLLHGDSSSEMLQFIRDMVSDLGVFAEEVFTVPPSAVSDHTSAQFTSLSKCIGDIFGSVQITPSLTVTSTCSREYERFCPHVYRFSPFTLTPVDQARLHGRGEGVRVDSLGLAISFYSALITEICL